MEIVKEEVNAPSWVDVLTSEIHKADRIATSIRKAVLMPVFTISDMVKLMQITNDEASKMINTIARYGYVESKPINGTYQFKILYDPQERINQIQQAIEMTKLQAQAQIDRFVVICNVTELYKDAIN
jgi:hypothetical protein